MKFRSIWLAAVVCCLFATSAMAQSTVVPGHQKKSDKDGNGIADAGVLVNNHYSFSFEWSGYTCTYVVNTRGDFGNTPYLDSGSILNSIRCSGFGSTIVWNYMIVHKSDPRYRGNPEWFAYPPSDEWEFVVLTESWSGNLVKR